MSVFSGLGHVAFRVNDLDTSLAFYEKLGYPEFLRLLNNDGKPWIAYLRITDELYLELFPGGNGEQAAGPERTGVHHLSLACTDLTKVVAHLETEGIELKTEFTDKRGVDGNRGVWIHDPDGNRIEIMEMAPDCIQYTALRDVAAGKPPHALVKPL